MAAVGPEVAGRLAGLRLAELDEDGLVGVVAAAEGLARWAAAVQLAAVGELVRRRGGARFVEDEVAAELRISRPAAAHRLGLAVALAGLPVVAAGLAAGRVDLAKARAVAEAVAVLDPPAAASLAGQAVDRAGRQTVGQLRAWLRRAVLVADPAGGRVRHEHAVAERRVAVTAVGDGMAELWALLPADEAARVYAALDACARDAAGPGDPRPADARRADALVDLLTGQRAAPADTTVAVTVPLATLLSSSDADPASGRPGQLAGIGPIPAPMARRLAADGLWRWLATTDAGTVAGAAPTPTGHRPAWPRSSAAGTKPAGSPAAGNPPTAATWTTPSRTRPAPPAPTTWPRSADTSSA